MESLKFNLPARIVYIGTYSVISISRSDKVLVLPAAIVPSDYNVSVFNARVNRLIIN